MSDASDKKKYAGITAVFWIVTALTLLIVFLVKQDDIIQILKETAFFEHVFGKEPEFIANYEVPAKEPAKETEDPIVLIEEANPKEKDTSPAGTSDTNLKQPAEIVPQVPPAEKKGKNLAEKPSLGKEVSGNKEKASIPPISAAKMNQHLCFVLIYGDGTIERKEVSRSAAKTDTPLTAALNALLAGPILSELEKGYMSLIPKGTRLLSASVNDRTAVLNFSEEFAFNKYGVQGYLGQLMQIVYTATVFNTIDKVQFLIDGEKNEFLGGEGVWIGSPLTRSNFK